MINWGSGIGHGHLVIGHSGMGEQADQSNLTPDEAAHDLFLAHLAAAADAVI